MTLAFTPLLLFLLAFVRMLHQQRRTMRKASQSIDMTEPFELASNIRGEILFSAQLKPYGYIYRIVVDVFGQEVFFEPDEERSQGYHRAGQTEKAGTYRAFKGHAEALESIVK